MEQEDKQKPLNDPLVEFGKKFKDLLDYHGVSQSELAHQVDELTRDIVNQVVAGSRLRATPLNFFRCLQGLVILEKFTEEDVVRDWLEEFYIARGIRHGDRDYKSLEERPEGREILRLIKRIQERLEKALEGPKYITLQGIPVIGRDEIINDIVTKLPTLNPPFMTLVGEPGVGKSEVARQIHQLVEKERYYDQVLFLPLEGIFSVDVAMKLIKELTPQRRKGTTLLILDNCEQIKDLAFPLQQYITAHKNVTILATSTVGMSFYGDRAIKPLPANDAIQLFCTNAHMHDPDFTLNAENTSLVTQLCEGLDGLPLALLIVSSWVKDLGVEYLCESLTGADILDLEAPPQFRDIKRHINLEKLFDWSYQLFDQAVRTLFIRLGIFADVCSIETVIGVCDFDDFIPDKPTVLNWLKTLSSHHLIYLTHARAGIAHHTLRDFAKRRLDDPQKEALKKAFCNFYDKLIVDHCELTHHKDDLTEEGKRALEKLHSNLIEDQENVWAAYATILDIRTSYLHKATEAYLRTIDPNEYVFFVSKEAILTSYRNEQGVLEPSWKLIYDVYIDREWRFYRAVSNILETAEQQGHLSDDDVKTISAMYPDNPGPYITWVYWELFLEKNRREMMERDNYEHYTYKYFPNTKFVGLRVSRFQSVREARTSAELEAEDEDYY